MKKKIFYSIFSILMLGVLLFLQGCSKLEDFGNTNINPVGSTTPITAALLTSVESQLGEIVSGTAAGGTKCGLYCQYFSETQYADASKYALQDPDFSDPYATTLQDCQVIINRNTDAATSTTVAAYGSNANQIAIAKILKTYIMWTVTDRWGDVPYSEAFKSAGNIVPAYDNQKDIYPALLSELKAAVAGFDNGLKVKGDIIYDGDQVKWKKLANSLRMLIALRISRQFPNAGGYAAVEFKDAYISNDGYIALNTDNFTLKYPGGSFSNTWYNTYLARSDYGYCKTFADVLAKLNDTRSTVFADGNIPVAYGGGTPPNGYSKVLSDDKRAANSPIYIVTATAVSFAIAEAAIYGWITAYDEIFYKKGVTQSFEQWGLTIPPAYLNSTQVNYSAGIGAGYIGQNSFNTISDSSNARTENKLQRIALQRWIALYPDGVQGWSEWRRTGFPKLYPTKFAVNSPGFQIPRRFKYGPREYNLNPLSLQAAIDRLTGGDNQASRIWWDK